MIKPFEGNSEAGFDAISLEFEINADKYQEIADTCCERLLLTGSKDLDGIYYKSDRVMNGKAAYATRETDRKKSTINSRTSKLLPFDNMTHIASKVCS